MNPRTVCFCHPIDFMISASVAPFLRRSMATTWAVLLLWRGAAISGARAPCLALGAFFTAGAFARRLDLGGRGYGRLCATLCVVFGFRLGGLCRLGRDGRGEAPKALPDEGSGGLVVFELLDRLHTGQAIPDRRQAGRSAKTWPVRPTPVGW
jgi:hypothetical protein